MSHPTQYELVSLFYLARTSGVTGTDMDVLNDVRDKWQKAAGRLRALADLREFELTPAEIANDDADKATAEAARVADLIAALKAERAEWAADTAHDQATRDSRIAEIDAVLAGLGA